MIRSLGWVRAFMALGRHFHGEGEEETVTEFAVRLSRAMVVEVARDSERRFNAPIETSVPLVGETRGDSLHIAELLLRGPETARYPR